MVPVTDSCGYGKVFRRRAARDPVQPGRLQLSPEQGRVIDTLHHLQHIILQVLARDVLEARHRLEDEAAYPQRRQVEVAEEGLVEPLSARRYSLDDARRLAREGCP